MGSPRDADFLFAGAGAAGLVTAVSLLSRFSDARAILVDPSLADLTNRTYAFWCAGTPPFPEAVDKTWREVELVTRRGRERGRLETHRYHVIRGADLRAACLKRLAATGRAEIVQDEVVATFDSDADGACVSLDGKTLRSDWLFDSRPTSPPEGGEVTLVQRFVGWDVRAEVPTFDGDVVTLFDFRTAQQGDQRFVYVLPYSNREALVEHVSLEPCDHAEALEVYLRDVIGIERYEVTRREAGESVLTDAPYPRKLGAHTLAIGITGGRLKPTSGYAFTRIVDDAEHIADSLESQGHPFALPGTPPVFAWLDHVFLEVTERSPERMAEIFAAMFHFNPPDRVLSFLDEHVGASEILALGANLPVGPFLRAAGPRFLRDLAVGLRDLGD